MPDSRTHRGAHPEDQVAFSNAALPALCAAAYELSWLWGRAYAPDASLKLVGDHHQLSTRQRKAVARAACAPRAAAERTARRLQTAQLRGRALAIDGFNCLITVEALLSGAPLFRGCDGALRDLASVHGTYRSVSETQHALELLVGLLARLDLASVHFFLDRPVGNSGRTRAHLEQVCSAAGLSAAIELSNRVDRALVESGAVVASSDSWILDHAPVCVDLPAALLAEHAVEPWLIDFWGASIARDPRASLRL